MVGYGALAADDDAFTERAGTGDAGLRDDDAVFTNIGIVRDVAQCIELAAGADTGFTPGTLWISEWPKGRPPGRGSA